MPTKIYLLSVPLDSENNHTLYFPDKTTQLSYFTEKIGKSYNDYNYQRQDEPIYIDDDFDTVRKYNYAMYQNPSYDNKWFFCFIKEIKFISEGVSEIHIETDVIQTYLFDYKIDECFIDREHVKDDTVGLHTLPENLEKGEYVCNQMIKDLNLIDYVYILQVTESIRGSDSGYENLYPDSFSLEPIYATNYGGIPVAGGCYIFDNFSDLAATVYEYDNRGKGEAVFGAYMIPKALIINKNEGVLYSGQSEPTSYELAIAKPDKCNLYKPKNNKLLCYPYSYLLLSNNNGVSNIYHFENFDTANCKFKVKGVPVIGGSIKCSPLNYKGVAENEEEGITGGKYPILSWSQDVYLNWLTQNSLNLGIGLASSGASLVAGLGMMAVPGANVMVAGGMALSGLMGITNQIKQSHQASFSPNSAKGNVNGGDISTCDKTNTFYLYAMSIKREYAKMIDKYFDMYGYKVSTVKVPNKDHRENYWFTKTIDANITGPIPHANLQKIINCYNKGITFWRHTSAFRSYNVDNGIV